ncbi:unnamed protein product [Musa acuminata subsp. malaccensis]|uniref:(wild Malaysian banana) hypothetical protein n=1 Tax=Musa acuminata subsp. malaccensis TaxID=214687 RepID=A0A804L301_MUSAM|nr:unnamed protein product [Musa acuminata subsp. malaccensis]
MEERPNPMARGFLSGNSWEYHSMNGFCRLPIQFGCQKTLMSFSHGSSRHNKRFQPRVVPHQTRAFHGNLALSVSAKGVVANRPLSPHLPVKKPQLSATFSISHRIFGASLGTVIMLTPLLMKFSTTYNI